MGVMGDLRWTAGKLMGVSKFAVDSAVTETLKGGMQVYAIVKGKLNGPTLSVQSDGIKKQNYVAVEEMLAKLERLQEDMNDSIQQQSEITSEEQMHLKHCSNEPFMSSNPEVTDRRKIFIRSRL